MSIRKPFMVRLRDRERKPLEELAIAADVSEAEVARRLLVPALTLAQRYGLNEVAAELRRLAQEAAGLSGTSLKRKVARAKSKLPLKASRKNGPKMQFG